MTPQWLLVAFAALAGCYFASDVLIPLLAALFLSVLLEPLVAWGEARGLRRSRGAVLVVLAFFALAAAAVWACARPFSKIAADMPRYSSKIRTAVSAATGAARRFEEDAERVKKALRPGGAPPAPPAEDGVNSWSQFFWRGLGSFFEAAGIAVFVPFLMIFGLGEKALLRDAFERLAGASCDVARIERETAETVRAFFFGNFLVGLLMAFLHWGVFAGLGLQNAAGLGLATGALTLLPIVGLPVAMLLPLAQGLLQFNRALPFVLLAAVMTGLHLFATNVVVPRVIGERVKINATTATAGLLFWGWLWGVTGFVLAVPLTALLKILLESGRETAAYAGLLAAKGGEERPWFGRRWLAGARRLRAARGASRPFAPR